MKRIPGHKNINVATTPSYEKPNNCEKDIELFERLQDEFIFYKRHNLVNGDMVFNHFTLILDIRAGCRDSELINCWKIWMKFCSLKV